MADPTPTTELEAVNTILSAIGELPTTGTVLSNGTSADVVMAKQILDEVNREVQAEGWHFNTDNKVKFTGSGGNIVLAAESNIVRVTVEGRDLTIRYTSGERRLYDKEDNTYVFSADIEAEVVYLFEFFGIPEAAKRYITVRAARLFQDRMVGSANHHKFTERDEFKALLNFKEYEGSTDLPSIFDSLGTFNIIKRGSVL